MHPFALAVNFPVHIMARLFILLEVFLTLRNPGYEEMTSQNTRSRGPHPLLSLIVLTALLGLKVQIIH